jgi:hypothetical protein
MTFSGLNKLLQGTSSSHSGYGTVSTADTAASTPSTAAIQQPRKSAFETPSGLARRSELAVPQLDLPKDPGFTPDRRKLASYILALEAVEYPTTPEMRASLRELTDVKSAAKAMFPYGNPDVSEDILKTGGVNVLLRDAVSVAIKKLFAVNQWGYSEATKNNDLLMEGGKYLSEAERAGIYSKFGVMQSYYTLSKVIQAITFKNKEKLTHITSVNKDVDPELVENNFFLGRPIVIDTLCQAITVNNSAIDPALIKVHDSDYSALYKSNSYSTWNENMVKLKLHDFYGSSETSDSGSLDYMVKFMHGRDNIGRKLAPLVEKEMSSRNSEKVRAKTQQLLAEHAREPIDYHTDINKRFAGLAAEAIAALSPDKAQEMAVRIAHELGATEIEAQTEACVIIEVGKELRKSYFEGQRVAITSPAQPSTSGFYIFPQ